MTKITRSRSPVQIRCVKYTTVGNRGEENTAMKENSNARVLVREGSTNLPRRHARARESFMTIRFEERKRIAAAYGTFWYLTSRRFC